jgi:hypothetical protein
MWSLYLAIAPLLRMGWSPSYMRTFSSVRLSDTLRPLRRNSSSHRPGELNTPEGKRGVQSR